VVLEFSEFLKSKNQKIQYMYGNKTSLCSARAKPWRHGQLQKHNSQH
jgi:hypothetical protein